MHIAFTGYFIKKIKTSHLNRLNHLLIICVATFMTTPSLAQSFEPQIVPGPFWKPKAIADERGYFQKPITVYDDGQTQWMVPQISELRATFKDDAEKVTMLYSYNKKSEETVGYVFEIDPKTRQFALFGRAMQEKYFQKPISGADKQWSIILRNYQDYVKRYFEEQRQLAISDEERLIRKLKQTCPNITDTQIAYYRQHPETPTDNYGCPIK